MFALQHCLCLHNTDWKATGSNTEPYYSSSDRTSSSNSSQCFVLGNFTTEFQRIKSSTTEKIPLTDLFLKKKIFGLHFIYKGLDFLHWEQRRKMLIPSLLFFSCSLSLGTGFHKMDNTGKRHYQIQHGSCSYTFLLPEVDNCRSVSNHFVPNTVQRDSPEGDNGGSVQRLQQLENIMENNTQWLQKVGCSVSSSTKGSHPFGSNVPLVNQ